MSPQGRPTVVVGAVTGRAARSACRSLQRDGFRVVGTFGDRRGLDAGGGPFCDVVHALANPRDDGSVFANGLLDIVAKEQADVVMQTDNEAATEVLARLHGRTSAAVVGPDTRQYSLLCDKAILPETAKAAGLASPATVHVDAGGAHGPLPPLPCIVKPATVVTGPGWGDRHRSASVAHTEQERDELVREFVESIGAAVVQEQVVGKAWRIHFVAAPSRFAALPVLTRLSYPRDAGMSTVQWVPESAPETIFTHAERLIRHVGYVGPGSVQFLERAGSFYVHDVNLRLPSSVAISIKAGLDMPALAARCALGRHDALDHVRLRRGVTYVWLGGEARALRSGLRSPRRAPRALATFAGLVASAALRPGDVLDYVPVRARLRTALADRRGSRRRPTPGL